MYYESVALVVKGVCDLQNGTNNNDHCNIVIYCSIYIVIYCSVNLISWHVIPFVMHTVDVLH